MVKPLRSILLITIVLFMAGPTSTWAGAFNLKARQGDAGFSLFALEPISLRVFPFCEVCECELTSEGLRFVTRATPELSLCFLGTVDCDVPPLGDQTGQDAVLNWHSSLRKFSAQSSSPWQEMMMLSFPDSELSDVLRFYGNVTCRKVWVELGIDQKVAVVTRQPVPVAEALSILRGSLLMEGIELREVGNDVFVSRVTDPTIPNLRPSVGGPRLSQQRVEQLAQAELGRRRMDAADQSGYSRTVKYVAEQRSWMVRYSRKDGRDDFTVVIDDCSEEPTILLP